MTVSELDWAWVIFAGRRKVKAKIARDRANNATLIRLFFMEPSFFRACAFQGEDYEKRQRDASSILRNWRWDFWKAAGEMPNFLWKSVLKEPRLEKPDERHVSVTELWPDWSRCFAWRRRSVVR